MLSCQNRGDNMRIYIYDEYGDKFEINSVDYTQVNGIDITVVYLTDYSGNDGTWYTQRYTFANWLSMEQILHDLKEIINNVLVCDDE